MKKFFALTLIFVFILSIFSGLNLFALKEELLSNPGLESGNSDSYTLSSSVKVSFEKQYARTGNYGVKVSNRKFAYSTFSCNLLDIVKANGPGIYKASFWIRLADDSQPDANCHGVIKITDNNNKSTYSNSSVRKLTTNYVQFTIEITVNQAKLNTLTALSLYPQTPATNSDNKIPDICLDDFSFIKTGDITYIDNNVLTATRSETTSVGAIRWDAWYSHDGRNGSVVSAVEKSLSPAQFHHRAPFFAEITEDNNVVMPDNYTQKIFDREMEYAIYAGIDYFAYVWYDGALSAARKFHTKSKYKNDVKMCVLFDNNAIGKSFARTEMREILKQDFYMTVLDGSPLMYYLYSGSNLPEIHADIKYYSDLCSELGIKQPFAMIMAAPAQKAKEIYANGISDYAIQKSQLSFKALTEAAEKIWEEDIKSQVQYIPCVTAGWSPHPRYINPPFWTAANGGIAQGNWCEDASAVEIFDHLAYGLSFMQHENVKLFTKANTVIMYAWNEHDEGGWICPTLKVDENGNQLYNDDGTKQLNESRINAVKLAIDFYKSGKKVAVTVNGVSNNVDLPSASSLYDNIDEFLNTKVFEGIPYGSNLTSSSPQATVTLPPSETAIPTETISPINTDTASTPTNSPIHLPDFNGEPTKNYLWLYVAGGIVVFCILASVIVIVIKKKKS